MKSCLLSLIIFVALLWYGAPLWFYAVTALLLWLLNVWIHNSSNTSGGSSLDGTDPSKSLKK